MTARWEHFSYRADMGVRALRTGLTIGDIEARKTELANALYRQIPVGVVSTGRIERQRHDGDADRRRALRGRAGLR